MNSQIYENGMFKIIVMIATIEVSFLLGQQGPFHALVFGLGPSC